MKNIYTDGEYLENNPEWHVADSEWKSVQILKIIQENQIEFSTVAEIGCGAGGVICNLQNKIQRTDVTCYGFDISPQAIEIANDRHHGQDVSFICQDILKPGNSECFDVMLIVDVFEHVPDYLGFVERCQQKAKYKLYHIPLDIHVSSVFRNRCTAGRKTLGHLHYFTADSAIASLEDTGHEIVDMAYTNAAVDLFWTHPTFKKAVANVPRWLLSKFSLPFTARLLGGYSLLVLAK